MSQIVIIGGGPAGYEAALVAAQLDADVTVVEADGAGGACVLSDCVPSKTFIASSEVVTGYRDTEEFGVHSDGLEAVTVDARAVHERVKRLALAQSADIHAKLRQGRASPSWPAPPGSARTPSGTPTGSSSPPPTGARSTRSPRPPCWSPPARPPPAAHRRARR